MNIMLAFNKVAKGILPRLSEVKAVRWRGSTWWALIH